jgi:hypothetical protein
MRIDSRLILAAAIVFATSVGVWMFRYEGVSEVSHRNRITGAYCYINENCW